MTLASGEVLRPVACRVGTDLGAALEEEASNILMPRLTGERQSVEVLVGRCRRFEADALVEEGLHDGAATVGDGVDDGAVPVEVEDGGIGRSGDEEATDIRVAVDGGVVEGVTAVDVGLGDGDTLLEAYRDERKTSSAGGL